MTGFFTPYQPGQTDGRGAGDSCLQSALSGEEDKQVANLSIVIAVNNGTFHNLSSVL